MPGYAGRCGPLPVLAKVVIKKSSCTSISRWR